MKNLRKLGAAVVLTLVLGFSAFAGEVLIPPCAPPDPGEVLIPPCASTQMSPDDSMAPGKTPSRPASIVGTELLVTDVTMGFLQSVLLLF
jgi:hypothetical protein